MEKLYKDYGERVAFLFVSGEEVTKTEQFLKKRKMEIPSYQPITSGSNQLSSRSIPATFIIGKSGKIHVKKIGAANWNSSQVRELLDALLEE